jgi:hypothetical protein
MNRIDICKGDGHMAHKGQLMNDDEWGTLRQRAWLCQALASSLLVYKMILLRVVYVFVRNLLSESLFITAFHAFDFREEAGATVLKF